MEGVLSKKTIYGYVILVVAAVGHNPNHAFFYRKKGCFSVCVRVFLYITKPYYSCSLLLFFRNSQKSKPNKTMFD
jgi:hypothetical protein